RARQDQGRGVDLPVPLRCGHGPHQETRRWLGRGGVLNLSRWPRPLALRPSAAHGRAPILAPPTGAPSRTPVLFPQAPQVLIDCVYRRATGRGKELRMRKLFAVRRNQRREPSLIWQSELLVEVQIQFVSPV